MRECVPRSQSAGLSTTRGDGSAASASASASRRGRFGGGCAESSSRDRDAIGFARGQTEELLRGGSSPALLPRRLVGTEGNDSEALGRETGPRVEFGFYLARPCLLESVRLDMGIFLMDLGLFGDFT